MQLSPDPCAPSMGRLHQTRYTQEQLVASYVIIQFVYFCIYFTRSSVSEHSPIASATQLLNQDMCMAVTIKNNLYRHAHV